MSKVRRGFWTIAIIISAMVISAMSAFGMDHEDRSETADDFAAGNCGENVVYELDKSTGILTIRGSGEIQDYSLGSPSPFYNDRMIKEIVVEDGVTGIGDFCFSSCENLANIEIPESVTRIGRCAFSDCYAIENITIPDGVTRICGFAFRSCSGLRRVALSDSVAVIEEGAFYLCSKLTEVYISSLEGWMNIDMAYPFGSSKGGHLFLNGEEVKDLVIPDGVRSVGNFMFCKYLMSVEIPDGVTEIRPEAFAFCENIVSVTIPDSVTEIGEGAFDGCSNLVSISIPEGVKDISCFAGCSNLASIRIPNSVTIIGVQAFADCTSLTSVTIPEGVVSIEEEAFAGCSHLQEIWIPESVKRIERGAFNLEEPVHVYYEGTQEQWDAVAIDINNNFDVPIHLLEGFTLSANELTIPANQKKQLTAGSYGRDLTGMVSWESSNPKVAVVDSEGNIMALAYGKSDITASVVLNGRSYKKTCTVQTRYYDVIDSSTYYFRPVYWAADRNITKGYGNVYFGPEENCTREQMITFLYRTAGSPAVSGSVSFSDVKKGAYYYNAVLWAYKNGITKGYSSGPNKDKFGVGLNVTREDTVTFIYRMAGKPEYSTTKSFKDIVRGKYYYDPVRWAAQNNITKGYPDGTFGVGKDVLRQDIVTFLYRYAGLK